MTPRCIAAAVIGIIVTAAVSHYEGTAQTIYPPHDDYQIAICGHGPDDMLVGIKPDGTMVFGPNYTPDAAAKVFWDTVERINPGKCRGT